MKVAAFITLGGIAGEKILEHIKSQGINVHAVFVVRPKRKSRIKAFVRKVKSVSLIAALKRAVRIIYFELHKPTYQEPLKYNFVSDLYSEEFLSLLRKQKYDVFISISDEIWKKEIFKIPKYGMLNAHPGKVPKYRGLNSIEEMLKKNAHLTISGHLIDEGIDTGPVIHFHYFSASDILCGGEVNYDLLHVQQATCIIESLKKIKQRDCIDTFFEQSNLSS